MNTNQSKRPSDAVIEAARDLAKRLPSGQAEPAYHACLELRRLRKALAELDRQRAETCTARDDTPSKSRTKRIAIQRAEASEATESSIALAQDWARTNAGEHADTIVEALAAYDPERVGERTVAKPAQGAERWTDAAAFKNFHRSLCARFGYPHDETYWWRDQVSLEEHIASLAAQSPQHRAVTDEDVERACVAHGIGRAVVAGDRFGRMRAALEAFAKRIGGGNA